MNHYSPSMKDGKIVRLSVSQLSRFDTRERGGCQRKWYFRYVSKIPDPPKAAQQEGIDGHKRFESYFNGQAVVWLDCDVPALQHLPAPGPDVKSEVGLERLTCLRIPFQGSMDLVHGRDVYDYKYQSQIRVYQEPTAQLWGYLEEVRLRDNAGGGRLGFHHVYISKRAPFRAEKVSQYFEPREVERNWGMYGSMIQEMHDVAAEPDVEKVPFNRGACYAYGPCPYLSICNRNTPLEAKDELMGFLDEIEAAKKQMAAVQLPEVKASILDVATMVQQSAALRMEINAQTLKALPPDAPPPDAVPTAPEATLSPPGPAPEAPKAKRGRPSKAEIAARNAAVLEEVPDGRPKVLLSTDPKPTPPILDKVAPQLKSLRLGLTIGLPEYSSAHAFVEMAGADEEELAKSIQAMITRRLEKLIPAYQEAIALKNKK